MCLFVAKNSSLVAVDKNALNLYYASTLSKLSDPNKEYLGGERP